MAFYRFTRACRQVVINYLQSELGRSEKHWDGSEWVELPEIRVVDAAAYTERELPAVVTDTSMGNMQTLSFNNVILSWQDTYGLYGPRDAVYQVRGGRGNFDLTLYCAANDREIQQRLVDITTAYLTIGRGWIYYYRHLLLGDVRILGDGVDGEVQQERVWYANLTIPATADWRLLIPREQAQQIDIEVDIVTPDDPFEDPRNLGPGILTPMDPEGARDRLLETRVTQEQVSSGSVQDLMVEKPNVRDLPLRPMRGSRHSREED